MTPEESAAYDRHLRNGKPRPGQWGWRARMLRARRLDRAEQRREREYWRRETASVPDPNRAAVRAIERRHAEAQARGLGIEPLPGEFTTALRARVEAAAQAAREAASKAHAADLGAT